MDVRDAAFEPPTLAQRMAMVRRWAEVADGRLRIAMVAPARFVDPERFGVVAAGNFGLSGQVFLHERPGASDPRSLTHFRAIASVAMRHVLVDHARGAQRLKRGGDRDRVTLSGVDLDDGARDAETSLLDAEELDAALARLATEDARAARVVELRFFGGLTEAEIAALLGVTERTVRNDWRMARAWLRVELGEDGSTT